jgi:hypothetical protein
VMTTSCPSAIKVTCPLFASRTKATTAPSAADTSSAESTPADRAAAAAEPDARAAADNAVAPAPAPSRNDRRDAPDEVSIAGMPAGLAAAMTAGVVGDGSGLDGIRGDRISLLMTSLSTARRAASKIPTVEAVPRHSAGSPA